MNKKWITWVIVIIGLVALAYGLRWVRQSNENTQSIDNGQINEEDHLLLGDTKINSQNVADYCWTSDYDTLTDTEFLIKGKFVGEEPQKSPKELIGILNIREEKPKIQLLGINSDTLNIKIINDEFLIEQMGSHGAFCFLGETVFTLTENENFNFVKIDMHSGSHAGPGIYTRDDFAILIK